MASRITLAQIAAATGYGGLELGPYGYMPLDAKVVGAELARNRLSLIAGMISDDLVNPANRKSLTLSGRRDRPAGGGYPGRRAFRGGLCELGRSRRGLDGLRLTLGKV